MPDADEGRAFLSTSLLSTRDITPLTTLATDVQVNNACCQHVPDDRISEVHFVEAGTYNVSYDCLT